MKNKEYRKAYEDLAPEFPLAIVSANQIDPPLDQFAETGLRGEFPARRRDCE